MPWSATVEVMLPPRGASNWNQEFVFSWRVGAIVAIYDFKGLLAGVGMPRTGYVHVHNIPDTITLDALQNVYCAEHPDWELLRTERRKYWAKSQNIPGPARNALKDDRQLEVQWDQIKGYVVDLVTDQPATDADFLGAG